MEIDYKIIENLNKEIDKLKKENKDLRKAARLIYNRSKMISGNLAMHECDEFCGKLNLKVWEWGRKVYSNQKCKYYIYQKDRNNEIAISHCTNPKNKNKYEGNCTNALCPLDFYLEGFS